MSTPSIPNLLSLRGGRGGRGDGRRRGRGPGGSHASSALTPEATVQGTDTDAAVSRLSAVDLGYLADPYARFFVQAGAADGPPPRRLPIINRGTYTRTAALDALVDAFLSRGDADSTAGERQIVSLGAGTDTRPLRLFARPNTGGLVYHEIDFEVTSARKVRTLQANPLLSKILVDTSTTEGSSWTSHPPAGGEYHCHGLDLRQLSDSADVSIPGLRTDIPTLILSECCLCYLSAAEATQTLAYFTSRIPHVAVVIYEPTLPDDAFGKMMVSNLAARHIRMPTLEVYREPRDQEARLRQAGFATARQATIRDVWEAWIAPAEKDRVDALEGLDEVEEWKLLAGHYVVAWGSRGEGFGSWAGIGAA